MTSNNSPAAFARTQRVERLTMLARLIHHGHVSLANAFLCTPHPLLHGKTPLACADSEADTAFAERVLQRLVYGVVG